MKNINQNINYKEKNSIFKIAIRYDFKKKYNKLTIKISKNT